MIKRTIPTAFSTLSLLILLCCGCCQSVDKDWSLGCFKQTTSNSCFNVTAGDYSPFVNLTGAACVSACSALPNGARFAGLTANGVCVCSELQEICLNQTTDTSCNYPQSDGFYYKVFPVAEMPRMETPTSVVTFERFNVTIRSAAPNCSYTLDFDDGARATISTNKSENKTTHYYVNVGEYKVTLSAHPKCLPRGITAIISSNDTKFANASLDCPDQAIEVTAKDESCELEVLRGSGINVTDLISGELFATLPDTVVETLGFPMPDVAEREYAFIKNGTYVMPLLSAASDGYLLGIDFPFISNVSVTIQILSPKCLGRKPCRGGCVSLSEECPFQTRSEEDMLSSSYSVNVSTYSERNTTYEVSEEFQLKNDSKPGYIKLPNPIAIKRGDVIAFNIRERSLVIYTDYAASYIFWDQRSFGKGDLVHLSDATISNSTQFGFQFHVSTPVVLTIPVQPKIPRVSLEFNVSSSTALDHKVLKKTVEVQERISGVEILAPSVGVKHAQLEDIVFKFSVFNGTNVTYSLDPGDESTPQMEPLNSTVYQYQQAGNYTFTVIASNNVSSVNASQNIAVVVDVKNLKFSVDPKSRPGEVNTVYNVSFSLEYGERPVFVVDFGNNVSVFLSCKEANNTVHTVNTTYTDIGTYNISVIAFSGVLNSSIRINSSVVIMQAIENLTLYQVNTDKNITRIEGNYSIDKHRPEKQIHLRADVSSGWPVHYEFTVEEPGNTRRENGKTDIIIPAPLRGGKWKITAIAENDISSQNFSITINVIFTCDSWIEIYDRRPKNDPFRTKLGSDIRINTDEKLYNESCPTPRYGCWSYTWRLYNESGQTPSGVHYERHEKFFSVRKGDIKETGLYRVEMVAVCNDSKREVNTSTDESYFKVEASDPVAIILGGVKRDVSQTVNTIVLDASTSFNPDVELFDSSGLRFNWTCVTNCSDVQMRKQSTSKVEINATSLSIGKRFKVRVTVTTTFGKDANQTQIIEIVDENFPTTEITCRVNCLPVVKPTDRLSLEGRCTCKDRKNVEFVWTILGNGAKVEGYNTTTGFNKENFVLSPNTLKRDIKYEVRLKTTRNGSISLSRYEFETAGTLTGGTCRIDPRNGTAVSTDFQVKCSEWKGGKFPLTYKISYQSPVRSSQDKKEYEWILWYQGNEQASPLNSLPAGRQEDGYSITVIVEIEGRYGEYVKQSFSVKVEPAGDKALSKSLDDLKHIDGKTDPQKLAQQVIALSQELNNRRHNGTTAEIDEEKKNRETLIEKLSTVEAKTIPLIQQTSNALTSAAQNPKQVNHETQESAGKTLKKLSENFLNIANTSSRTGEEIDKAGENLLTSWSTILNASLFTGQDTSKKNAPKAVEPNLYGTLSKKGQDLQETGDETGEIVKVFDESMKLITTAIVKRKLLGEEETVLRTPKFNVKLKKMSRDKNDETIRFNGSALNVDKRYEPWISLPLSELTFPEGIIVTEVVSFETNIYTSDVKHSHFIQPRVFSFTFRDEEGEVIPVENLSQEIEIRLPNERKNILHTRLNFSADNEDFLLFSFQVDDYHYNEMIMIDIRNSSHARKNATFYLKYGEKVSPTNYDFKHQHSLDCRNCSGSRVDIQNDGNSSIVFIREAEKVKSAKGIVSVGLLLCPDTDQKAKLECDPKDHNFSSFVQTVSCRYWNSSEWKKEGCKVGLESTPLQTSCLCNHLTAFSSYIVKPNPLNKFSVEDFKEGYVSFVAVMIIFLLYFLSLIWARRVDRSDSTKVGVCGLAENRPSDQYRYEIAIWTGMRRNAGTRSEVTIILSGEKNDSEARSLVNPQNPNFARGSLEKFLLTSSQDIGSLYCIRVWHDNSRGSWYLSRVMVTDLQKDERYYFICDRWLAVDEDDGQVERLLPVASDEELADFHHLFYSKAKRGLSDTHLWVSVLNRPPQSIFTRVQRLSCCLCIIMTTMFANAMFYQTRSEPTADSTNFIGSYSFTWDEVYIGVVSSLIIVPVNVLILHIFRNVRPKSRKTRPHSKASLENLGPGYNNLRNSNASFQTLAEPSDSGSRASIAANTINVYSPLPSGELKRKREQKLSRWAKFKRVIVPSSLPHWFVYVGWIILVLVTLGSATVVVLYGMQFGNGRSLQWLFSIVISIAEDIFVLQPLKVLLFALAFALLVKKPDEGEFGLSGDYDEEELEQMDILGSQNSIPEKKQAPSSARLPVRPTEEQLAVMRKTRLKERKMLFLIQEITVHLIFTIVIALVTYGHKDQRAVHLYRHIDELSTTTDKINNFSQFWNWSRTILIPKAFAEQLYNGDYVSSYGFFDDGYNNLISKARMRVLRVKNESCDVAEEFKEEINVCLKDYSIFNQDEVCYRPRWDGKKGRRKSQWCFQNWKDLDGYPTWGTFTTYSGSGYIRELRPGDDNNETVNELESDEWLDRQARALFVEMTTYNANINLYTSITLLFEFPEFGGIFYFRNIIPMRLKLYVGGFAFFILACEIVFVIFTLGYSYIALKKLYRHKMAYFKNFWNVMDFAILMSSFAAIGVYVYRVDLTTKLMERVQDRDGEFVNFQYVTYVNEVLNCIIALVVALTTVKLTKLMRFNLRISLFGKTLQDAKPALAGFSIQFGIVFFAYVMVGVLVFGYNVSQFKSIMSAMMSLGRVILGKSQFRELFVADPLIGPLFFLSYVMFVCWILVTMFVAILNDSYHEVQDRCFGMSNEYEIVDFVLARFRAWSGMGGKAKNPIPADQRWRRAGIKAKAAATLGRQRSYKPSEENVVLEKTGDLMERLEDSIRSIEIRVQRLSAHFK